MDTGTLSSITSFCVPDFIFFGFSSADKGEEIDFLDGILGLGRKTPATPTTFIESLVDDGTIGSAVLGFYIGNKSYSSELEFGGYNTNYLKQSGYSSNDDNNIYGMNWYSV
jgi:hypothetical protein